MKNNKELMDGHNLGANAKFELPPHQESSGDQIEFDSHSFHVPAASHSEVCAKIRAFHRILRFAMKSQFRVDRSMEAFVRCNAFGFDTQAEAKEIERISKATLDLLKKIRSGKTPKEFVWLEPIVQASDASSAPWAAVRVDCEKKMRKLAGELPCVEVVEKTLGFGALGLAQLIGEIGNLDNFGTVSKVWKRMGFAPFKGYAASSLKSKRDGVQMSNEDWTALGYSPKRYAIAFSIADSMFRHQIESAAKSETTYGKPVGVYGEVYVKRRHRTAETHPDWSKGHAHSDALRVMMKALLRDIYITWHGMARTTMDPVFELPSQQFQGEALQ